MQGGDKAGARHRAGWRGALAAVLCMLALDAQALRDVDPGEEPKLGANEGLLVLAIDNDSPVRGMRLQRVGGLLGGEYVGGIEKGVTTRMFVVPAGRYRWTRVDIGDYFYFDYSKDEELEFEVRSGEITYAGDMVFRATGVATASARLANRALAVIDWLQAKHPAWYGRLPLVYRGHYPDPFPAFYRELQTSAAEADAGGRREAPQPGALPLAPKLLWAPQRITDFALSPDGRFLLETVREGDTWALDLIDIEAGTSQRVSTSEFEFIDIRWESDAMVLATIRTLRDGWLHAFHLGEVVGGRRAVRHVVGPANGRVVDMLPGEPRTILYEDTDSRGVATVHRLHLDSAETVAGFRTSLTRDRLNKGVEKAVRWFADGQGQLRAAFAMKGDDRLVLMHGRDGKFREVMEFDDDSGLQLQALSYDGERFYGFTDDGRAQRELVEFDPAVGKVTRTLYARPGVDLSGVVYDERRTPVGATYYQDGRPRTDWFDTQDQHVESLLRRAFPGRTALVAQRSRDARRMVLVVDGSDLPPQLYVLDLDKGRAQLMDDLVPELAGKGFAPAEVLKVRSSDGLSIDAFLTLPPAAGKRPLVVMAHGGPIGISDDLHFNREVQFLASLGYAVLQVNYRGSDGYGRAFREAGHRNYGRLIEDDVDAAVRAALAAYPLDADRMCTLGTSYGGYSAMVSTIRWPGRFRCAVSIAGVSDRALFFTASDSGRSADTRKVMEKVIGNPNTAADLAEMRETSPLYRYRDLSVPVMLVHGGEDARVDFEHTRRLVRMLNLAGKPPVLLAFDDEGHGIEGRENNEKAWTAIAGFLQEHLGTPGVVAGTPAAGAATGTGAASAPR